MAELSEAEKLSIVQHLAQFRGYAEVVVVMRELHETETDVQQVRTYDPTNPKFAAGDKWRKIFDATREAYLKDVSAVPLAHQAYRLNLLQQGVEAARKARNWNLVASLCEQAAKEVGGILTKERHIRLDDSRKPRARDMSPEERREAMVDLVRRAQEQLRERSAGGAAKSVAEKAH